MELVMSISQRKRGRVASRHPSGVHASWGSMVARESSDLDGPSLSAANDGRVVGIGMRGEI